MNVLKDKSYKSYGRLSRYSLFPYYYNTLDDKYIYGTTTHLDTKTSYTLHKVVSGDTYDSLALYYYNNPTYFWVICNFNSIQDPFVEPKEGTSLKIPSLSTITFTEVN